MSISKQKEDRYGRLVNLAFERGLAPDEEEEKDVLFRELAALDEPFYRPLIEKLQTRG